MILSLFNVNSALIELNEIVGILAMTDFFFDNFLCSSAGAMSVGGFFSSTTG